MKSRFNLRYWRRGVVVKLRWWFWNHWPHTCVENEHVRIGMARTICARCGRVMFRRAANDENKARRAHARDEPR